MDHDGSYRPAKRQREQLKTSDSHRPVKRQRKQLKSPKKVPSIINVKAACPARSHSLDVFNHQDSDEINVHSTTNQCNGQTSPTKEAPSTPLPPSLGRFDSPISNDNVCHYASPQCDSARTATSLKLKQQDTRSGDETVAEERYEAKVKQDVDDLQLIKRGDVLIPENLGPNKPFEKPLFTDRDENKPPDPPPTLGRSISPPTSPVTPPEFVYEHFVDPDFSRELEYAFERSKLRLMIRRHLYGADVADEWKRGSTPEEAREKLAARRAAEDARDAESASDSDSDWRTVS